MTDPVFGHVALDFRSAERRRRQFVSWVVVGALLCLVVIVIVAINVFRDTAEGDERFEFAGTDTSPHVALLLNIAQVQILNAVFSHVARALTLYENWRTDVQYTNALIGKLFLFKFVNTFASVADVAFIKGFRKDNCGARGGCLHALGVQVGTLFVSGGAAALVAQVVVPTLKQRRVRAKTSGDYGDDGALRVAARRQFAELVEYDNVDDAIADYMEIAIQFGFLACFGASFAAAGVPRRCSRAFERERRSERATGAIRRPRRRCSAARASTRSSRPTPTSCSGSTGGPCPWRCRPSAPGRASSTAS